MNTFKILLAYGLFYCTTFFLDVGRNYCTVIYCSSFYWSNFCPSRFSYSRNLLREKNSIPRPSYVIRRLLLNGDMPFLHQSSDGFGNSFLARDVRRSGQGLHSDTTDVLVITIGEPKEAVINCLLSRGLQT